MAKPFILIGLGNPGDKYVHTRHNVGFEILDYIQEYWSVSGSKLKGKNYVGTRARIWGEDICLIYPTTYMNLSGKAVREILDWLKLDDLSTTLVIVDDYQIPFSTLRIKPQGSSGGHNGLKNIEQHLHTKVYPRLRVGIGPIPPKYPLERFVLSRFSPEESKQLSAFYDQAAACIKDWIQLGIDQAMMLNNKRSPSC